MLDALHRHPANTHLGLMLALTFTTGIVDAVGYLGLDRVFTGNMTGNVVILGMGLAGGTGLPVLGPTLALLAFMTGAAVGGRVLRGDYPGWTARHTGLFGAVAAMVLLAALAAVVVDEPSRGWQYAITASLGLAMGCQAATARHIAVKDITTVVVTSTITGLAADSVLGSGTGQPWKRRTGAIALIALGAFCGALMIKVHIGLGMLAAGLIIAAVTALGHFARPRAVQSEGYDS